MSKQYDPYTDTGFGYSCLCGDYDHGTVPERIICAACKVEEQKHQLATLTQERDLLQSQLSTLDAALTARCQSLEQERDALREVTRALIRAGDALYVRGKFADPDYWASCNWATVVEESANLLPPSGEAGKGGGA